jgi:hypothetical protein
VRKRTGYLPWLRRREDAPFRDDRLRGGHIGMAVVFRLLDAMRTSSTAAQPVAAAIVARDGGADTLGSTGA